MTQTKSTSHRHQSHLSSPRKPRSSTSATASTHPSKAKTKAKSITILESALSVHAPKPQIRVFDGDALQLAAFFDAFEAQTGFQALSDAARITALVQCASRSVAAFWRTLDGYNAPGGTYAAFKEEICWVYHGQGRPRRYRVRDLENLVRAVRAEGMHEARWRAKFEKVAGWLKGNGDITEGERRKYWEEGMVGMAVARKRWMGASGCRSGLDELIQRTAVMEIRS